MSAPAYEPLPPNDEALPIGRLLAAAGVTLAIFAAGLGVAWWLSAPSSQSFQVKTLPASAVEQRPFALEAAARALRAEQQRQLATTGWVDRPHQLVHIPIERAIDQLLAAQQRGAGQ